MLATQNRQRCVILKSEATKNLVFSCKNETLRSAQGDNCDLLSLAKRALNSPLLGLSGPIRQGAPELQTRPTFHNHDYRVNPAGGLLRFRQGVQVYSVDHKSLPLDHSPAAQTRTGPL